MRITPKAAETIIGIMKSQGLSPKDTYLQFETIKGRCAMSFVKDKLGRTLNFHGLTVVIRDINMDDAVVDYYEEDKRRGILICPEKT